MAVLKTLLIAASVLGANANPRFGWMEQYGAFKRDTSFPSVITPPCVDFVIGADQAASGSPSGAQVCLTPDASTKTFTVKFPAVAGYTYDATHVWVGCDKPKGEQSDNSKAPGQYPYTSEKGGCTISGDKTTATCTFDTSLIKGCSSCDKNFYIVTHASLTKKNADGTTSGVTGAGQGTKFNTAWHRMYWNPSLYCLCTSTITFPAVTYSYTLYSTSTTTSTSSTAYLTTVSSRALPDHICLDI